MKIVSDKARIWEWSDQSTNAIRDLSQTLSGVVVPVAPNTVEVDLERLNSTIQSLAGLFREMSHIASDKPIVPNGSEKSLSAERAAYLVTPVTDLPFDDVRTRGRIMGLLHEFAAQHLGLPGPDLKFLSRSYRDYPRAPFIGEIIQFTERELNYARNGGERCTQLIKEALSRFESSIQLGTNLDESEMIALIQHGGLIRKQTTK